MELTKNAYSPNSLAEALEFLISDKTIRRHIKEGKLKAQRFGGRNIIITRANAELWLNAQPSATEKTTYHGRKANRRIMSPSEKANWVVERERRRKTRCARNK